MSASPSGGLNMANGPVHAVLDHLRKLQATASGGQLSDAQLLQRFLASQDEAAFNVLLQRHGPMVWSVCQRVLRCEHHAEDVFQATFLVLARKAASIRQQQSVASWLYGVAYRLARQQRARELRRPVSAATAVVDPAQDPSVRANVLEWQAILDEELHRLSEHYRMPLVLCFLEGKTRDEAAEQLGWSLSTLKRRLDRAREVLRHRLSRRGVALSGALLATVLSQDLAAAHFPAGLLVPTGKAALLSAAGKPATTLVSTQAVILAEGVLQAMMMTKVKLATAVVLALATIGVGVGFYSGRGGTTEIAAAQTVPVGSTAPAPAPPQKKDDLQALQEKIAKLQKQLEEARQAELYARQLAEAARAQAEAAALQAREERDRAMEALAVTKAKANVGLPGKLKVRLADNGAVSVNAKRLAVELIFSNDAPEEGRFSPQDIQLFLLDKNGERVAVGLRVQDPDKKVYRVLGGKGQTTVLAPEITLDPVLRPGEEYCLVLIIGNQAGMVRFTTKE
jgi:RNA polymerase sigma factor (sigma-70 family)